MELGLAELARGGGLEDEQGWLRLELPVQSLRISTLRSRLIGTQDLRRGGYRPRLEVDRPLLLLRGDDERWLDAGFGDLPDREGERLIADLRAGRRETRGQCGMEPQGARNREARWRQDLDPGRCEPVW